MRTLSAALTTLQQAVSGRPAMQLLVDDGAGGYDTYDNYTTSPYRIRVAHQWEEPFASGMTVDLIDSDKVVLDKSYYGRKVQMSFGFLDSSNVFQSSKVCTYYVAGQRTKTDEGEVWTELECYNIWGIIAGMRVINDGCTVTATGAIVGQFEYGEELETNHLTPLGAKFAGADIAGTWINIIGLTAANLTGSTRLTGATSGAYINYNPATGAADKNKAMPIVYNADVAILDILKFLLGVSTGAPVAAINVLSDDTDEIPPGSGIYPYRIGTYKPVVTVLAGYETLQLVAYLMNSIKYGLFAKESNMPAGWQLELNAKYLDPSEASSYTYGTDHKFKWQVRRVGIINPNSVAVVDRLADFEGNKPSYYGTATDAASVTAYGANIWDIQVDNSVTSNAIAAKKAEAIIAQRVAQTAWGVIRATMNVGQELWDVITIIDSRSGKTYSGRIGRIDRYYNWTKDIGDGGYDIELTLGLNEGMGSMLPAGAGDNLWNGVNVPKGVFNEPPNSTGPVSIGSIPKSALPLTFTMAFAPDVTDFDSEITWTSGTITFADGTTQSIDSGSVDLDSQTTPTNLHYIYATLGSSTLGITDTFGSAVGPTTFEIALVKKASVATEKVVIVPASGGTLGTFAKDSIVVNKLSAITADMGLLTAGEIRVGTGTPGGSPSFTGFSIDSNYIAGYASDVLQAYIRSSDGKFVAGAGSVIVDVNGITITYDSSSTAYIKWMKDASNEFGRIIGYSSGAEDFLRVSGYKNLELQATDASSYIYILNDLYPKTTDTRALGKPTLKFDDVHSNSYSIFKSGSSNIYGSIYAAASAVFIDTGELYLLASVSGIIIQTATGYGVDMTACDKLSFPQSYGTPSGAANGDVWYDTKYSNFYCMRGGTAQAL